MAKRVEGVLGRERAEELRKELGMIIEILEMEDALMRTLVSEERSLGICFNRYMPKDRIELNYETYKKLMKAAPELVGRLESLLEK